MVRSAQTMHRVKISTISNKLNQASTWASSPRSTIGCVQNDFWANSMFSTKQAPILNWHQHYLQMDQNKIPQDPCHLGVPSGASKMISKPAVRSAQTVHLSCVKISTISKRTESSIHLSLVTKERHQVRPKRFLILWHVRRKPCTYLASRLALYQINWIKHPLELRYLGILSCASKTIYEPIVCLAQTVHLSWTDTNTIFKWTKPRFHMTHITLEFHRVRPKRFLRQGYVRHIPCTYLASRLPLSLNGLNWAPTCASKPRSTIGSIQDYFWAYGTFGANHAPILRQD
jgi:hypothetical protein